MLPRLQPQTQNSGSPNPLKCKTQKDDQDPQGGSDSPKVNEKDKDGTEAKKHRYTGSAESISYLKEDDPLSPTGERWVLERRRTAESGEVEFLAREVVSGGRI